MTPTMLHLDWDDVYERLAEAPMGKLYGVPRGGAIVAGLTGRAVNTPGEADVIVDDIVDSGQTREKWKALKKPFWALVNKQTESLDGTWVHFPWELEPRADVGDNVTRLLEFLGENPKRDGLADTPRRVIKSLVELTTGYQMDPASILKTTFDVPYDEMVVLKDMEFWSLCEHHMLPFHGKVHVGYIPTKNVVGISKLARLVDCYARRLQVQERMTQQIAEAIQTHLKPQGVGVVVEATHLCMSMRGVEKPAVMKTSCLLGVMRDKARAEFLALMNHG